jgi:catechol 2,3-dioxygenase-like lactoylglutathione lyase family enzyme
MTTTQILSTHVALDVADLEATIRYLEEVLEIPRLRQVFVPGLGRIVWFPGLELMQATTERPVTQMKHVAWEVENIVEAMNTLKARGVTFESDAPQEALAPSPDTGERVRYCFFSTPVGLSGELTETRKVSKAS